MVDVPPIAGHIGGTAYRRAGRGEGLVLVHGVGMNSGFWSPQLAALAAGRDMVAYDMLGHGASKLPPEKAALRDYAGQLLEVMDGLRLDRAAVVGHSMGALVALEFALAHPERVEGVVAMNAVYRRTPAQRDAVMKRAADLDSGLTAEGRRATLRRWLGDPVPPHLADVAHWIDAALAGVDPVGYARTYRLFAAADEAHAARLSGLRMPTLFLTGELDANSSPAMSRAMAADAPCGRAMVLPGERHMMSLVSPAPVNAVLLDFLREPAAMPAMARD